MRTRTNGYRQAPHSPRHTRSSRHPSKAGYVGADGYDAFENTNNKKKRKIPTSGSTGLHHANLSAELAQLGLNSGVKGLDGTNAEDGSENQYSTAVANGTSTSSQNRHGRDGGRRPSARSPLAVSTSNSNVTPGNPQRVSPTGKSMPVANCSSLLTLADDLNPPDKGIISAAIANATALLRKPLQRGQDSGVVLDEQPNDTSPNTQFTFTCETEEAKGVSFPEQSLYAAGYPQRLANSQTGVPAGTSANTSHTGHPAATGQAANGQYAQQPAPSQAAPPGDRPRRRRKDIYKQQAYDRRLQQDYANRHHGPIKDEDKWTCQFCEYEDIFGVPPSALLRQYEIKDRRERKRLEEKRRLLEKAKMKGRKGKKQSKNAAKAANGAHQQPLHDQPYDDQAIDQQPLNQYAGDEYLEVDEGFDDDSIPLPAPPPAPLKPSMPGSYDDTRWEGSPGHPASKGHSHGRAQY